MILLTPSLNCHNAEPRDIRGVDMTLKSGSLIMRLRLDPKKESDFVPLPGPLLRKYIAYARTFVFPRSPVVISNVKNLVSTLFTRNLFFFN